LLSNRFSMKSILALLCIVALAHADVQKSGGLKGSWDDTIFVTSATPDEAAPMVDYQDSYDALTSSYTDFGNSYTANTTEESAYDIYFYFSITNELSYSDNYLYEFGQTGGVEVTFWTTFDTVVYTLPTTCYIWDDLDVDCTLWIQEHYHPGVYAPMITAWDMWGNWATYTETAFATAGDQATFTLQENDPDLIAPTISGATVTGTTVTLGTEDDIDAGETDVGGQVQLELTVNDGNYWYDCTPMDADAYDAWSSGINEMGVWATLTTGEDEDMWSWDIMLSYEECDTDSGDTVFAKGVWFYNTADAAEYTVSFTAYDMAGNMATPIVSTSTITVEFDNELSETNGGAVSCQTFDIYVTYGDTITEVTVTDTEESEYIYLYATCTEKEAAETYVTAAFTTEEYTAVGTTDAVTYTLWDYLGGYLPYDAGIGSDNFGWGVNYQDYDVDSWDYHEAVGNSLTIDIWASYLYIPPGSPANTDYYLSELNTVTSSGSIQRYNLADGAASSVVPSVFAVLFAALLALLRL
jgi:hypothetical protein